MIETQARLVSEAVLPALCELSFFDGETISLISGWRWAAGFSTLGRLPVVVSVGENRIEVQRRFARPGELNLLFLSPSSLLKSFSGGLPIPPPIPTSGLQHLAGLPRFDQIGKRLKLFLEGAKHEEASVQALRAVFGVLSRALPILAETDPLSRKALLNCAPATAELRLDPLQLSLSFRWDGNALHCKSGACSAIPNLNLTFETMEAVRRAVAGNLDFQAAVGRGDVRVEGRVLFADALGVVMDRADLLLKI